MVWVLFLLGTWDMLCTLFELLEHRESIVRNFLTGNILPAFQTQIVTTIIRTGSAKIKISVFINCSNRELAQISKIMFENRKRGNVRYKCWLELNYAFIHDITSRVVFLNYNKHSQQPNNLFNIYSGDNGAVKNSATQQWEIISIFINLFDCF